MRKLLLLIFLAVSVNIAAQDEIVGKPEKEIAHTYLKAFYDLNYKKLKRFYTEESYWHDPSTALIFPAVQKSIGKDKIIADLKNGFKGVFEARYAIEKEFYSGPFAALWGTYSYKIPAKYFFGLQESKEIFYFEISMVTNLLIKDGKIIEHLEHANWTDWARQAQENASRLENK